MRGKHDQSSSRVDYHVERLRENWESFGQDDDVPDHRVPDDSELREQARRKVRVENERIWAYYRDPETGLTQVEARDRAQRTDYPDRYQIVQSSVSRLVGELDDRVLTEPLQTLKMRRPEGEAIECGLLPEALVDDLGARHGGDVLDELRESVARFIVDWEALHRFAQGYESTPTPPWARDRFPDLDPDVGRKALLRNSDLPEEEVHQPTAELEAAPGGVAHD